jgi:hypothetical protein
MFFIANTGTNHWTKAEASSSNLIQVIIIDALFILNQTQTHNPLHSVLNYYVIMNPHTFQTYMDENISYTFIF